MNDPFIQAIVDRVRDVVARHSGHALDLLAEMLGLEPRAFRALIEEHDETLNTAFVIDVVAAFVRDFAIDPRWLLTGQYDANTHRRALMLGDDRTASGGIALRELVRDQYSRLRDGARNHSAPPAHTRTPMSAINFSANGTRWRALPITNEMLSITDVPGTGVLFTSADGEMLFLSLQSDAVPTLEALRKTPNAELGLMVQWAKPLPR